MTRESLSTANYAAVIKDLRSKRDEIDRAIATLEAMAPESEVEKPNPVPSSPQHDTIPAVIRKVHGATGIGDACASFLEANTNRLFSTREVLDALVDQGFSFATVNPMNNVWAALGHRWKSVGDVERRGKKWRHRREKAPISEPAHMNGADHQI